MAKLYELKTVYGIEDCYDMLETANVRSHNNRMIDEENRRQAEIRR